MAILSTGIKLSYKAGNDETYTDLTNLQEIPEIGNTAPEKVDTTVLTDTAKKSISGLIDTAQDLAFKFLYDETQFATLAAIDASKEWKVTLPDSSTATFSGTPSVKINGVGAGAVLTYTLTIAVETLINFA